MITQSVYSFTGKAKDTKPCTDTPGPGKLIIMESNN